MADYAGTTNLFPKLLGVPFITSAFLWSVSVCRASNCSVYMYQQHKRQMKIIKNHQDARSHRLTNPSMQCPRWSIDPDMVPTDGGLSEPRLWSGEGLQQSRWHPSDSNLKVWFHHVSSVVADFTGLDLNLDFLNIVKTINIYSLGQSPIQLVALVWVNYSIDVTLWVDSEDLPVPRPTDDGLLILRRFLAIFNMIWLFSCWFSFRCVAHPASPIFLDVFEQVVLGPLSGVMRRCDCLRRYHFQVRICID